MEQAAAGNAAQSADRVTRSGGVEEWKGYWTLPVAAAFGASSSTLGIYSMGAFMRPLQEAFGWSRAEVSSGIFIASCAGIVASVLIGMLVDRFGPRRIGILGVIWVTFSFGLLGTITGAKLDWLFHWLLIAVGSTLVLPTVWASAVSSRFVVSRGLALGVTLCGSGIGSTTFPLIGTWLITNYGWRTGFIGLGAIWAALVLPMLLLFFRGANDGPRGAPPEMPAQPADGTTETPAAPLTGLTVREGLTGGAFYKLTVAGFLFSLVLVGLIVHLIPILEDGGMTAIDAAARAGVVGIFTVIGRLVAGALLDRLRPDLIGGISFLLPVLACGLLLAPATGTAGQLFAVSIVGLSVGGEFSVVTYLCTRYFGMRSFGRLYGAVLMPMAIGTASGPVVAGGIYDFAHSYTDFLHLSVVLMLIGAVALFTLGRPPAWENRVLQEQQE